jgi:hypothetical protein
MTQSILAIDATTMKNSRKVMKRTQQIVTLIISGMACATLQADTLELADGTLIEGEMVGSSNNINMFNTGGEIEAYPESEVVGIYLSSGVATREAEINAGGAAATTVTVPAGTRLVIRMTDSIDSKKHQAGHRFKGQLESALVVDGVTVAPRGTFLYGQVAEAKKSRRLAGSSSLTLAFNDIMINDQLIPMATIGLQAQTGNEAGKTVGRTARSAAIGGLIGGSSGAKTGAKVGVGASILTSGASINVPAGTIVETELAGPLDLPL